MTETKMIQTAAGEKLDIKNKWGETRSVVVGRAWDVVTEDGGEVIGKIRYRMLTRERRGKGKRYVYSRWQSPGWEYSDDGHYWAEPIPGTKKECLERIVRDWEHRNRG